MTRTLFEIIRAITFVIWGLVGFIFWLPFLIRMIAFFTGSILVSVGGGGNISVAQTGLDKAVRFYPSGFVIIHDSISSLINGKTIENKTWNAKDDFWLPLVEHFVFAIMFWGLTMFTVSKLI